MYHCVSQRSRFSGRWVYAATRCAPTSAPPIARREPTHAPAPVRSQSGMETATRRGRASARAAMVMSAGELSSGHEPAAGVLTDGRLLVVLGVGVHLPRVALVDAEQVPGRDERGHHRVVLVVVLVHAVAAAEVKVRDLGGHVTANRVAVARVLVVVDGI